MASAWPSGRCRVARGTTCTNRDQAVPSSCQWYEGTDTQATPCRRLQTGHTSYLLYQMDSEPWKGCGKGQTSQLHYLQDLTPSQLCLEEPCKQPQRQMANVTVESVAASEPLVSTLDRNTALDRGTEALQSDSCSATSRTRDPSHVPSLSESQFLTCKVKGLSMDASWKHCAKVKVASHQRLHIIWFWSSGSQE